MREVQIINQSKITNLKLLVLGNNLISDSNINLNYIILAGQFIQIITASKKDESIE